MADVALNGTLVPNGNFPLINSKFLKGKPVLWTSTKTWDDVVYEINQEDGGQAVVYVYPGVGTNVRHVTSSLALQLVKFVGIHDGVTLEVDAGATFRSPPPAGTAGFYSLLFENIQINLRSPQTQAGDSLLILGTGNVSLRYYGTGPCFPTPMQYSVFYVEAKATNNPGTFYAADTWMTGTKDALVLCYFMGAPTFQAAAGKYFFQSDGGSGTYSFVVGVLPSASAPNPLHTELLIDPAHNDGVFLSVHGLALPNVGTAGTVGGGSNFVNSLVTDAQGRVTSATAAAPAISTNDIGQFFDMVKWAANADDYVGAPGAGDYTIGMNFQVDRPVNITGMQAFFPAGFGGTYKFCLWNLTSGTRLLTKSQAITANAINTITFDTPYSITNVVPQYAISAYNGVDNPFYYDGSATYIPFFNYGGLGFCSSRAMFYEGTGYGNGDVNPNNQTNSYVGMYPIYNIP